MGDDFGLLNAPRRSGSVRAQADQSSHPYSRHDNLLQHHKTHAKNGKTRRAVMARLAQVEAARAAKLGFTHTFVEERRGPS